MPYANNKGADQTAHLPIQNFKTLASLCSWKGRFVSYLVANLKDRFFRDEAQMSSEKEIKAFFPFLKKKKKWLKLSKIDEYGDSRNLGYNNLMTVTWVWWF